MQVSQWQDMVKLGELFQGSNFVLLICGSSVHAVAPGIILALKKYQFMFQPLIREMVENPVKSTSHILAALGRMDWRKEH